MAGPTIKVTHFWEQFEQGWTESYYTSQAQLPGTTPYTGADLDAILAARAKGVVFTAARWVLLGAQRQYKHQLYYLGKATAYDGTLAGNAAVYELLDSQKIRRNRHWMRGLASNMFSVDDNGVVSPSPFLGTAIQQYESFLEGQSAVLVFKDLAVADWQGILSLTDAGEGTNQTIITRRSGQTLPAINDTVEFKGLSQDYFPGLKGQFKVLDVGTETFKIGYRWRSDSTQLFPANGYYRKAILGTATVKSYAILNVTTRDTGRPTVGYRGRHRSTYRRL